MQKKIFILVISKLLNLQLIYKRQDNKADRDFDHKNYITVGWLRKAFGSCCGSCGDCFIYKIEDDKVVSNLTAQRIDNDVAHKLDNIIPYCKFCNCALSNKE